MHIFKGENKGVKILGKNINNDSIFLENNEGKLHADSKNNLFRLLTKRYVHLLDNDGYEYIIFPQENPTEFLHMEAFTVDYLNNAIYSDSEMSCFDNFNLIHKGVYCDGKPEYGVCWELPCRKCIDNNYSSIIKKIKPIGYAPDIAYGYDNQYKIWIEICNTHPVTSNKIKFCCENNIILLEVSAIDIQTLDDDFLMVMNRTSKKYLDAVWDIRLKEMNDYIMHQFKIYYKNIINDINIKGYSIYPKCDYSGFDEYIQNKGLKSIRSMKDVRDKYNIEGNKCRQIIVPI